MKIVHISTYDYGGAGLAAYRLHRGLLEDGIESRMLVAQKSSNDDTVVIAKPDERLMYQPPRNPLLRRLKKIMRRRGEYLTRFEQSQRDMGRLTDIHPGVYYTSPISIYNLSAHPLVKGADIIHLHWIQNFVNFETFFNAINKPIVWTHHDLNPIYGGFHYDIPRHQYYDEYRHLEDEFYAIKKESVTHASNISIVAISNQMHERIAKHEFYQNKPIFDIPNSVDGTRFVQHDRKTVRELLNIPLNTTVFLFSSIDLNEERKGLERLIAALELLKMSNMLLLCLGDGLVPSEKLVNIRHFGPVSDTEWLSMLYSAADFFVAPSSEESFLQTALESLSCGTPVIMTPVGIGPELITEHNGIICSGFSPESIAEGISLALCRTYDRDKLRSDVLMHYGTDVVVGKYIKMYNTVLCKPSITKY